MSSPLSKLTSLHATSPVTPAAPVAPSFPPPPSPAPLLFDTLFEPTTPTSQSHFLPPATTPIGPQGRNSPVIGPEHSEDEPAPHSRKLRAHQVAAERRARLETSVLHHPPPGVIPLQRELSDCPRIPNRHILDEILNETSPDMVTELGKFRIESGALDRHLDGLQLPKSFCIDDVDSQPPTCASANEDDNNPNDQQSNLQQPPQCTDSALSQSEGPDTPSPIESQRSLLWSLRHRSSRGSEAITSADGGALSLKRSLLSRLSFGRSARMNDGSIVSSPLNAGGGGGIEAAGGTSTTSSGGESRLWPWRRSSVILEELIIIQADSEELSKSITGSTTFETLLTPRMSIVCFTTMIRRVKGVRDILQTETEVRMFISVSVTTETVEVNVSVTAERRGRQTRMFVREMAVGKIRKLSWMQVDLLGVELFKRFRRATEGRRRS